MDAPTSGLAECIRKLYEISHLIDSYKLSPSPGNSKLTIYSELVELKNTLDALRQTATKLPACPTRSFPPAVLQATLELLEEVHYYVAHVDNSQSIDMWNHTQLRLYQLDFQLAFQGHQLQEITSERFNRPSELLCASSAKDFWDSFFSHQVRPSKETLICVCLLFRFRISKQAPWPSLLPNYSP